MPRVGPILSRLAQSLLVLLIVYTVTFWMLMALPGDPFVGERNVPEPVRNALAARYHLDYLKEPPAERARMPAGRVFEAKAKAYVTYLADVVEHGDLGPTISYEYITVNQIVAQSLPVSVALGALALLLALWLGVAAGTVGAVFRGRWPDLALTVVTLLGVSLPTFVVGTLLLMLFGVYLPVLPVGGWGTVGQLVLPAFTLALFYLAYIARLTRASVLDTLSADYVRTARAKGLPHTTVIARHVLRNAALPVLSYLGPTAAIVLTGSFVVEKIFNIPGIGQHFVNACLNNDIPLVLGTVMVFTALIVVFNALVDIAYLWADPRIRHR